MSHTTDFFSALGSMLSGLGAFVTAAGVWYARNQLKTSRDIAQLQFEDDLAKEYRELAAELPKNALMGTEISNGEYEESFDGLYRYIDLTNEQISLRSRDRITKETWESWLEGIQANMKLPAFAQAWAEIKNSSSGFKELRRLEREIYESDPKDWS
ncbi:hypothetical protein GIB19_12540 [Pseudomonas sp. ITEM 17296]|jgi:hypothetical protein|uniref:hypothetical protein n=1 Tax=Pseudomonas sp. ITEM 17296 TaxID=2790281 RepID=UPI00238058B7|nr:hypothetical protein [Pseudomonas sp. ITEM 17296]MDE4538046.1 hypothetical protein [Pseudomonas sp. ITEM 17296]